MCASYIETYQSYEVISTTNKTKWYGCGYGYMQERMVGSPSWSYRVSRVNIDTGPIYGWSSSGVTVCPKGLGSYYKYYWDVGDYWNEGYKAPCNIASNSSPYACSYISGGKVNESTAFAKIVTSVPTYGYVTRTRTTSYTKEAGCHTATTDYEMIRMICRVLYRPLFREA